MKKKVLFAAAIFAASFSFAQDLTSKKGENILPEAGDYAVGFDATSFLSYAGNLFNAGVNGGVAANWTNTNNAIHGKYFVDANTAYRGMLRLGFGSTSTSSYVPSLTTAGENVEDVAKTSNMNVTLGAGMEKRRGTTRLQGVYGAQAMISLGSSSQSFEYGNSLADMGTQQGDIKAGSTFGLGLGVFVGCEYFLAPKISIGAEYGWGLGFSSTGEGENTTLVDGASDVTTTTGGNSSFGIDTNISGGSISAMFHF